MLLSRWQFSSRGRRPFPCWARRADVVPQKDDTDAAIQPRRWQASHEHPCNPRVVVWLVIGVVLVGPGLRGRLPRRDLWWGRKSSTTQGHPAPPNHSCCDCRRHWGVNIVAATIIRLHTVSPHLIVAGSVNHGRCVQQAHWATSEDGHREDACWMVWRHLLGNPAAHSGRHHC